MQVVWTEQPTADESARAVAMLREMSRDALALRVSAAVLRQLGLNLPEVGTPARNAAESPRFSVFEEFLAPEELSALTAYVMAREDRFRTSQVISHNNDEGKTDYSHRRSRVLFEPGPFQDMIVDRLTSYFPQILQSLGHAAFDIASIETQMTASNDGEFFKTHNDNTHAALVTREVTYVLFFHREPAAFGGGELRLYDTRFEHGRFVAGDRYVSIVPRQNMVVFFPAYFMHEVAPVVCPSRTFADSRFTLNGWIHR